MRIKTLALFALQAFCCNTGALRDAKDVVRDVEGALGAGHGTTIPYSGRGIYSQFGQNYMPNGPYPKFYALYSRSVDFEKALSEEDLVRSQFEDQPRGGGEQPLYREAQAVTYLTDNSPWGGGAIPLTPHGWVNAAMAANPSMQSGSVQGRPVDIVSFTISGKFKVVGYVNSQNLLEKVETWMPNSILGNTLIESTYSDYKDFGGAKFPIKIAQKIGGFHVVDSIVMKCS